MFQRWTARRQVEAHVEPLEAPMADCVLTLEANEEAQEITIMADATISASSPGRSKKVSRQDESTIEAVSIPSTRNVNRHEVEAQLYVQPFRSSLIESNQDFTRSAANLGFRD